MYLPQSFEETDRDLLLDFIEGFGFATLVSWGPADPTVSHVPLLVDRQAPGRERLLGHVARANDHWKLFDGRARALAMFHGPHGYVSPAWYETSPSVPTWSYAVAHVYGRPALTDDAGTRAILGRLVEAHEGGRADRWPGELPEDFVAQQLRAIVGFEIPIERLEGKFKLGQNRAPADREGALAGLAGAPDHRSRELAGFARTYFARRSGRS